MTDPLFPRPDWVRRINDMAPGVGGAGVMVSLDPDEIVAAAVAVTGLDDFGAPTWEEPYRRLVASIDDEARCHVVGRLMCRHDLIRHLSTRLRIVDAHRRDPALAATPVPAPIFITGPARSGTSILQELVALDPGLRGPLGYEIAYPLPPAGVDDATRRAWAECEFDLWADVHPGFAAVHALEAGLPEECLWLLAPEFDMGFWTTIVNAPGFVAWRAFTDPLPAYTMHRQFVQVLQAGRPTAWIFKSPIHMSRLPTLLAVYPDARILRTHRDPVKTMASSVSTLVHGRYTRSDHVDPLEVGAMSGIGLAMMLNAAAGPDAALPPGQIAEVQYLDLVADPVATVTTALETLGVAPDPSLPGLITDYLAARPQGHKGVHRYSLADFGLDADTIRAELAPYIEAFGVVSEA